MRDIDGGRAVALIVIGVYIGVGASLFLERKRRERYAAYKFESDICFRLWKLENPEQADELEADLNPDTDSAEES